MTRFVSSLLRSSASSERASRARRAHSLLAFFVVLGQSGCDSLVTGRCASGMIEVAGVVGAPSGGYPGQPDPADGEEVVLAWVKHVVMMLQQQMPAVLVRLGTGRTMTLCLALATLRWAVCASTVNPLAVALAQTFHAGTFAALHVAAVTHTYSVFGRERSATGQAIFSSMTYGVGNILGMVGSGLLWEPLGTPALFATASAMAFVATALMAPLAWPRKPFPGSPPGS